MSLYKSAKSPNWQYDFQIKGVRFHGSTGTPDKAAARRIEAQHRVAAAEGRARRAQMTLNEACERYFQEVGRHLATADTVDAQLARLIELYGAGALLSAIDDAAIASAVARRRGQKARNKTTLVAPATVNRETELLRRVLKRAAKVWKADVGEDRAWAEHLLLEPEERVRSLSHEEEARLFGALRDDLRPLVHFALRAGIRLGEARSLTWSAVADDLSALIVRGKSRRPGGKVRTVPLTAELRALLSGLRGQHPIYVFTFLCQRTRGKRRRGERYPFSASGWRRPWARALAAAGVEDFRFHDTRHTAATRTLKASGNVKIIQKMLGHTSITSTLRYAHVLTEDIAEAMEAAASRNSPGAAPRAVPTKRARSKG